MTLNDRKILFAAWACHNKSYFSYQTWGSALRKIFGSVITFDPQEETNNNGKKAMNARFLRLVEKEKPDYIFLWLIYDEFYFNTILKIRELSPESKIVNFFGDDDTFFEKYSKFYAPFMDCAIVSHKKYLGEYGKVGLKNTFFSCGVNTDTFHPVEAEKKYDVSFVGLPKKDRHEYLKFLIDKGISIRVCGSGWGQYPDLKKVYGGKLSDEEMVKLIASTKINLSFSKNYEGKASFKSRVFETCACRSFLLSEYFDGYLEFLKKDKEIVMFNNKEELLEKIKYYLKNEKERDKIAERAYKKVTKNYSMENEMRNLFEKMEKKNKVNHCMPVSPERVISLDKREVLGDMKRIMSKLAGAEYITFDMGNSRNLRYREYFQIRSLQDKNKKISCCDCYINSGFVGNYLTLDASYASKSLSKEEFSSVIDPAQLMVRKDYFLSNLKSFRKLVSGEGFQGLGVEDFTFVRIPLVEITKSIKLADEKIEKVFHSIYENELIRLRNQKKLLFSFYPYKLILFSLFREPFIIKSLKKRFLGAMRGNK